MGRPQNRVARGEAVFQELSAGTRKAGGLPQYDLVPEMGDWVTASLFGDVWGRSQLPVKVRSIATMSALTVLGRVAQLKGHVGFALNLGWTKEEIGELFMHLGLYGGLPATFNALAVAREVFQERGILGSSGTGKARQSRIRARVATGNKVLEELTAGHLEEAYAPEYELAPGMEEWVNASLFGEVWGRPGLAKKMRSIATMSALTVMGREPQLKGHVEWALNLGWKKEELGELFMHLALYGGLPASLNALAVARKVFQERGLLDSSGTRKSPPRSKEARDAKGYEVLEELTRGHLEDATAAEYDLAPGMEQWVNASLFGDVWGRPGLAKKMRSIATMSALTALGREPQLKGHIEWALNLGWKKEEIGELFMHLVFYGGLPASLNALALARQVFKERGLIS